MRASYVPLKEIHAFDSAVAAAVARDLTTDQLKGSERRIPSNAADKMGCRDTLHAIADRQWTVELARSRRVVGFSALACAGLAVVAAGFTLGVPVASQVVVDAVAACILAVSGVAVHHAIEADIKEADEACAEKCAMLRLRKQPPAVRTSREGCA